MKQQLEQFDAWLKRPGAFGIPRAVTVIAALLFIGTFALTIIILCK